MFSRCTPFPLVEKRKKRRSKNSNPHETPHWIGAFEADMRMGEEEAQERLSSYKAEITDLYDQALMGDELAIAVLVEYANTAIQALEQIARLNPKLLHPISEHHIRWPAFIGIKDIQLERNRALIEKLKLGDKSLFNHKWNPKSPATFTAYSMLYWLNENQSVLQLPPLSKATLDEWFETGWKGFSESLQGHPETYLYMRPHYEVTAVKKLNKDQEKRDLNAVIRDRIKKAVKQSFNSVTKKHVS